MTVVHEGKRRGRRLYARKFDHAEAQRRYDAGESITDLAAEYGVHRMAVYSVVTEAGRQAASRSAARLRERTVGKGVCAKCGAATNAGTKPRAAHREHSLCKRCAAAELATSVREDTLRCMTCREWKPDEAFPRGGGKRPKFARRGRHRQCRACNTLARQAYRERHKVPCVGCGKPALPPGEKGQSPFAEPRCQECGHKARVETMRKQREQDGAHERRLARRRGGAEARRSSRSEKEQSA